MIDCEQAQKLIAEYSLSPREEEILVAAALGRVNARDVLAPIALPVFDNSAMDGFVLNSRETLGASVEKPVLLPVQGAVKAGDDKRLILGRHETLRIMTGSFIPQGADAVLAKENAVIHEDTLVIQEPVPVGQNIRYKGEEIKKGSLVLAKNSIINPGTVGFLSAMGLEQIRVYQVPRISVIATGSELTAPGSVLGVGKIYDANTSMIRAALEEMRIRPVFARRMGDHPAQIRKVIDFCLKESDVVILMGGVSVGDFDFVKKILADAGVETVFWKVSQKPGKPLFFGKKENRLVFGLPGNPASVFTCFYEYVYPAIRRSMGYKNPYLSSEWIELGQPIKPDGQKTLFVKARIEPAARVVIPLKNQKSHMLSSFCEADSFVVVPGSEKILEKGEKVKVHSLPYAVGGAR